MELVTAFASIVGLFGIWQQQRDAREARDLDQFVDWLRRHEHQQLADLILDNTELANSLTAIVENQHEEVMTKLKGLDETLSSVASHVAGFGPLAKAVHTQSRLPDQAVSILRQMNEAGASKFIEIKARGVPRYQMMDGQNKPIIIDDGRFIEDDLQVLCELGLLRLNYGGKGSRLFIITRSGATVGK